MKRLALLTLGGALSACGGAVIRFQAVPPPPPPEVVVEAAPAPPAPEPPAPPGAPAAEAPPAPPVEAGVEEAPEVSTADPEEVTANTEPPDPIYEEQILMPGPGYFWVGGYWGWTGADWAWYGGRWMVAPEGRVYVEPYYERVGGNVVYVRGYWGPRDAPRRSYGGERIRFVAPVRPANYRRDDHPHFERRAGAAPGSRPPTFYQHATGTARPIPRATAPTYRTAAHETVRENIAPSPRAGAEPGRPVGGEHMAGGVGPRENVGGRPPAQAPVARGPQPGNGAVVPERASLARPPPRMAPAPRPGPAPRPNTPPPKKRQ